MEVLSMLKELLKSRKFSLFFLATVFVLTLASLIGDFLLPEKHYWFQRSGALIVLAGVELQYAKLVDLWNRALEGEMTVEPVESRIASGQGVSLLSTARESETTRKLAVRLHTLVTEKSPKDILAVACIIVGTIVWAYGDLPFKVGA